MPSRLPRRQASVTLLLAIVSLEGHHCQLRRESKKGENINDTVGGCLLRSRPVEVGRKNLPLLVKS